MILSQNAVKVRNNKYISQQIAEKQFNDKYGKKYKDTNPWKVFKDKYIEEWTLKNLSIEYFSMMRIYSITALIFRRTLGF